MLIQFDLPLNGSVARDPWSPLINRWGGIFHGWMRSLVDPVTRLVEETTGRVKNPRVGWANNIEKGKEGY